MAAFWASEPSHIAKCNASAVAVERFKYRQTNNPKINVFIVILFATDTAGHLCQRLPIEGLGVGPQQHIEKLRKEV